MKHVELDTVSYDYTQTHGDISAHTSASCHCCFAQRKSLLSPHLLAAYYTPVPVEACQGRCVFPHLGFFAASAYLVCRCYLSLPLRERKEREERTGPEIVLSMCLGIKLLKLSRCRNQFAIQQQKENLTLQVIIFYSFAED